jgi:hypothetical protein
MFKSVLAAVIMSAVLSVTSTPGTHMTVVAAPGTHMTGTPRHAA